MTRARALAVLASLALLTGGALADDLVYVFRLADQEIGRETVTPSPTGWTAKGAYDLMGQAKGDYQASLVIAEDGSQTWTLSGVLRGNEIAIESKLAGRHVTAKVRGDGQEREQAGDLPEGAAPVFYADLLWASFLDLGRYLAPRATAGEIAAGAKIPVILGGTTQTFELRIDDVSRSGGRDGIGGRWNYRIDFAGRVEFLLVTDEAGTPMRLAVPAQKVDVVLDGVEEVALPVTEPKTILDSGEWRKLLSPPTHEVVAEKKVMVPMRDGVRLATDVYRPAGEGKFPTVLVRTPYGRTVEGVVRGHPLAKRGYALVVQDVRGRFDSEGTFFPFRHEADDGSDAIDWIAAQPWSDGNVGMIGGSYVGMVQWYAARTGNPHLKAIVPEVSPPDPDQNIPYEGGAFLLSTAWWAKALDQIAGGGGIPRGVDWKKALSTLPLSELDTALETKHGFLDEWLAHPPSDAEYWKPFRYQDRFGEMSVAALNISGWFDGDQPGAVLNYPGMRAGGRTEEIRKHQYLVMGPWGHAFNASRALGDIDFGEQAVIDLDALVLRFFDRYLKGIDNGIDREDPVTVFTMGANRWHREKDWPIPSTVWTKLHLAGSNANEVDGGGRLALAPADGPADVFVYDPLKLPEQMPDYEDMTGENATGDKSQEPEDESVLDYTSPPLAGPVEITGPVVAKLWVSTDAADTDFVFGVRRVTADGKVREVCGGIQRLRYRLGSGRDAPVPPGEVVEVEIDGWATSLRFEKGDRIRVVIASSGFPGYARNLNTLEPALSATEPKVATNTVHHDAARPSHVLLPVVPREDAPGLAFQE